jgi:serine carboxypeptidase-like clade I
MEGSQVHINDGPRVAVNPYSWTKVHKIQCKIAFQFCTAIVLKQGRRPPTIQVGISNLFNVRSLLYLFCVQQMASLLLVDSPAGVGYSYADHEDDYTTDDTSRVADLYDFLSKVRMVYDKHSIYIVMTQRNFSCSHDVRGSWSSGSLNTQNFCRILST